LRNYKWTAKDIVGVKGKVTVITGANSGIGKEAARVFAQKGAVVVLAVRSMERGEQAAADIRKEFPKSRVEVLELDLSSIKSVKRFAKTLSSKYNHLDYLINNAGVMMPPYSKTEDGFELQFGTNHLGHFALTGLVLPMLKSAKNATIVNVSSLAHLRGDIDFDDLAWDERKYNPQKAYGDSKLANLLFTYELSRKLEGTGVKVTAAHPGWTQTNLQINSLMYKFLSPLLAQKPKMGALPTLRAAISPKAKTGDYFGPSGLQGVRGYPVKVASNDKSHDKSVAKKLWRVSEKLTGIRY